MASGGIEESGSVVLITGASGFIGRGIIGRLGRQYTLVGLDRAGPPDPPPPANVIDFDLTSEESVKTGLNELQRRFGKRIASVVPLAAYYDISGDPNPLYERVTVEGTRRLIDALQSFQVEQFVFASTMLVYKATDRPDAKNQGSSRHGPIRSRRSEPRRCCANGMVTSPWSCFGSPAFTMISAIHLSSPSRCRELLFQRHGPFRMPALGLSPIHLKS